MLGLKKEMKHVYNSEISYRQKTSRNIKNSRGGGVKCLSLPFPPSLLILHVWVFLPLMMVVIVVSFDQCSLYTRHLAEYFTSIILFNFYSNTTRFKFYYYLRLINKKMEGLPWQFSGFNYVLPLQGIWDWSLVRGLRSCMPCGTVKKFFLNK